MVELCLGEVEVRTFHHFRELSVQADTEVQHPTIHLHLNQQQACSCISSPTSLARQTHSGTGRISCESSIVHHHHPLTDENGTLVEVLAVLDLILQ